MACPECAHDDHFPGPCGACALQNRNCVQGIKVVGGDGEQTATGKIEMATGIEQRPCVTCRSFVHDRDKLIRHLLRRGLTPDEDGIFQTPIAKDISGRKSLRLDPRTHGFCQKQTIVVDFLATCPDYRQVRTASELESRIKS